MPRRREQHQAAITEQVMTSRKGRKVGVVGGAGAIRFQRTPGRSMWRVMRPRSSGRRLDRVSHSSLADDDVGLAEFPETADVVLVEVREDRRVDVAGGVAQSTQSGTQGLFWGDLEAGQTVVEHFGHAAGKIVGVGDRGSVLSGVEQHDAISVLDDVGVDGPGSCPLTGGEQPQEHGAPGRRHVIRTDLYVAGAHDGNSANRVVALHHFGSFAVERGDVGRVVVHHRGRC